MNNIFYTGSTKGVNIKETHLTQAVIHLAHLTHNMTLLQKLAGQRPLFPAIKANAYGHGAEIVARHLITLGYTTLCTAHISEAVELLDAGVEATFIILSPTLPQNSGFIVEYDLQPFVCTSEQLESLAKAAGAKQKRVSIHVKVDTGMGRMGVAPEKLATFLDECSTYPEIRIAGVCSHFPRADENDLTFSRTQVELFLKMKEETKDCKVGMYHIANSAAIFALPGALNDAVRPGISMYGLKPSPAMEVAGLEDLKPVMSLTSQITYLKEVEAETGISYGHTYHTDSPALIATIPVGYGDGINRLLSNKLEVIVGGRRCHQIGRICMDQCMIDVTPLRGEVHLGDEVVLIGNQGNEAIIADELAAKQGTINYEIVTSISARVPRIVKD